MNDAYQTRLESLLEAVINTMIGFWINFTANLLILPHFGFSSLTVKSNFIIGAIYTLISVARTYAIRRWAQDDLRAFKQYLAAAILRTVQTAQITLAHYRDSFADLMRR